MINFLPHIYEQTKSNLNSNNLIYLEDITLKAINDKNEIVGFVCENLTPIRFVGILDFGVDFKIFEDYRIFKNLTSLEYIYNNTISITPIEQNTPSTDAQSIQPYIESSKNYIVPLGTTLDLEINGNFFDREMDIDLGSGVQINTITSVTPTKIVINISTQTEQLKYPIKFYRGNVVHFGGSPTLTVTNKTIGTGDAGTYIFNPNPGKYGYNAFDGNWTLNTYGACTIDGFFRTSTSTTPSGTTGPMVYSGDVYLFTERSSPNYGSGNYGEMETSNFMELQQVSFDLHMVGTSMCNLELYAYTSNNKYIKVWEQIGSLQKEQKDDFQTITLDATSWDAKAIKFKFTETTNYSSDVCLKNITFVSI